MTVIALLQARNEQDRLPGWLTNLEDVVDGFLALDDGSEDSTSDILAEHPKTLKIITRPERQKWNERGNQIALIREGRKFEAAWFLCIDADERIERRFGGDLKEILASADRDGIDAFSFRLRELWGDRRHYRSDGIWGQKRRFRLFRNNPQHCRFDPRFFHRTWLPLEILADIERVGRPLDHNLYHLGMMYPDDREARRRRYRALDPNNQFQKIGYDYLVDVNGLELTAVPPERDFIPLDEHGSAPIPSTET